MIYTKDGLSKEQLIELLQYSMDPRCQFLTKVSHTNLPTPRFRQESVIRMLKIEEKVSCHTLADGPADLSYQFSVKILVEDEYYELHNRVYRQCAKVPRTIHNEVARILNG